jgi:general secretion pathway protein A
MLFAWNKPDGFVKSRFCEFTKLDSIWLEPGDKQHSKVRILMYLTHYHFREKPFSISPDPKFLWLGEKHKEALATLKYGILEDKGFLLLTGDIGTGKTALINALLKIIDVSAIVAAVPDPGLDSIDFFNFLSEEFKMGKKFDGKGAFLIQFKQFLHQAYADKKKVLLIIDEAQRLNHELLEQIRLLSNIEIYNRKLINIFFVGQSEFNDMLMEDRNKAVRQRITVNYHITPLREKETALYIRHRLRIAGTETEVFKPEAIRKIFSFSRGYPRLINIMCDYALLTGFAAGVTVIDEGVISECEADLKISADGSEAMEQKGKSVEAIKKSALNQRSPRPQIGKKIGIGLVVGLLLGFFGYLIYDLKFEESPRWSLDEIAPKADLGLSEVEKQALLAETAAENESKNRLPAEAASLTETGFRVLSGQTVPKEDSRRTDDSSPSKAAVALPPQKVVIRFEHNSNELPSQAYETLDPMVRFVSNHPESEIIIEGYTDSSGDYRYNRKLSKFRADVVKNYFAGQGIPLSRIKVYGRGSENQLESNATLEGRKQNRRVEVKLNVKK